MLICKTVFSKTLFTQPLHLHINTTKTIYTIPRYSQTVRCNADMSLQKSKVLLGDVVDGVFPNNPKSQIRDVVDRVAGGATLKVLFHGEKVHDGSHMSPKKTVHKPTIEISDVEENGLYTLLCTDPDPPDPKNPKYREWLHWMVTNICGGDIKSGTAVVPYRGPSPPIGTHRYVFTLFKQPSQSPIQAVDHSHGDPSRRGNFHTRDFAKEFGLGDPVAATFFMAHKED